jgi:hypothetical protein
MWTARPSRLELRDGEGKVERLLNWRKSPSNFRSMHSSALRLRRLWLLDRSRRPYPCVCSGAKDPAGKGLSSAWPLRAATSRASRMRL